MTEWRFPIEAGMVMLFARALGDENPAYTDPNDPAARSAGGVIAPPTYLRADGHFDPEWPTRPRPGSPQQGSDTSPSALDDVRNEGAGRMGLHAEQWYEFRRPVIVGDVLTRATRPGKTWEKTSQRSGKMVFTETIDEYRDHAGELVATARNVRVVVETNRTPEVAARTQAGPLPSKLRADGGASQ
jgi:hypothetical protein